MPGISADTRVVFWIVATVAGALSAIFGNVLTVNIVHFFSKRGRPPTKRPFYVWATFYISLAISVFFGAFAAVSPALPDKDRQVEQVTPAAGPSLTDEPPSVEISARASRVMGCYPDVPPWGLGKLPETIKREGKLDYDVIDEHYDEIYKFDENYANTNNSLYMFVTIQNIASDQIWARISNTIRITISAQPEPGQLSNLNLLYESVGCGGGPAPRYFPSTQLIENKNSLVTYPEVPSFSLTPGEYEDFLFPFSCTKPGRFRVTFEIPYIKAGISKVIKSNEITLTCPESFRVWESYVYDETINYNEYKWNGNGYSRVFRFSKGNLYVVVRRSISIDVREKPGLSARVIAQISEGGSFVVDGGPIEKDGFKWWSIYTVSHTATPEPQNEHIEGWVVENSSWYAYPTAAEQTPGISP